MRCKNILCLGILAWFINDDIKLEDLVPSYNYFDEKVIKCKAKYGENFQKAKPREKKSCFLMVDGKRYIANEIDKI